MALSDACFEFLEALREAAAELANEAHRHSEPDHPIPYGREVDALRRAAAAVADAPYDPETGARLLRLATSVMRYHDTPPHDDEATRRHAEMRKLIDVLQAELDPDEAASVPAVVENVVAETPFTENAGLE